MTLAITVSNQIKAYNLAICPTLPEFMEDAYKSQKSLKKNELFRRRIEVIQGFEFTTACTQIEETKDQQYIIASGLYAPTLKIFETAQLSLKCLRGLDSEIVKFCLLTEDYKKIALACEDRNIEIHAQYGKHYKTRVPKQPTDMVYNPYSCNLMIGGQYDEIVQLNLDNGSFIEPLIIPDEDGCNSLCFHDQLELLFIGGNKNLTTFDLRSNQVVHQIPSTKITSLTTNNLNVAVGTENGAVKIYDLRKSAPIQTFQHQYRLPIKKMILNEKHNMLVSADQKIIKFYNLNTGNLFTNIEPQTDINNFTWLKDTGMFMVALEQPRQGIYFIPQLDPAPKWCPFLDNLTEEMEEEEQQTVYDEYKFLTYDELQNLDALHLLETKMVKSYLHGYLIHYKLYLKLRQQKGLDFDDFKQQRIQKKLAKETAEEKQLKGYVIEEPIKLDKEIKITDERFKQLQENEYEIDKRSEAYHRAHPSQMGHHSHNKSSKQIRKRKQ